MVAAGLVAAGPTAPARALESPVNLQTSQAVVPVLSWDRVPGAAG